MRFFTRLSHAGCKELNKQKLALYQDIEARDFAGVEEGGSKKQQLQHLVLSAGILQEAQWIAFSEKALGILDNTEV